MKRKYILVSLTALALISLIIPKLVQAAECPSGADDCYMCGDTPCTKDCTGVWDEESQRYLSCECPQGEPCTCYCPYSLGEDEIEEEEITDTVDETGAEESNKIIKVVGNPTALISDTGEEVPISGLSSISSGTKMMIGYSQAVTFIPEGEKTTVILGPGNVVFYHTDDGVALDGVADLWIVTKLISQVIEGFEYGEESKEEFNLYTQCSFGQDTGMINQLDAGNQCNVIYKIKSEVLLDIEDDQHKLKVISGEVEVTNQNGDTLVVKAGSSATITDTSDLGSAAITSFDLEDEDPWWTEGYKSQDCPSSCGSDETQSPFPGCSCISSTSDTDTDSEGEPLGGLYSPVVICLVSLLCLFLIVVIVVVIVIFIIKKGSKKK